MCQLLSERCHIAQWYILPAHSGCKPENHSMAGSYLNDNKALLSLSIGHSAQQLCTSYNLDHPLCINAFLHSSSNKTQPKTAVLFNLCFILSNYFDMAMLPKIILFIVLQSREIMLADVLINNHETVNLPGFLFLTWSSNLNVSIVKPQGQRECQYHHPWFTDRELKHRQVK